MAAIIMGSARHDEFGKYLGGKLGDQLQKKTDDFSGEVSMQYLDSFVGSRAWYVVRPKQAKHAQNLASCMKTACNNINAGYDQGNRLAIVRDGVGSSKPTEGDCGTYVRACVKTATGKDPGNFTTDKEVAALEATGLFDKAIPYKKDMTIYEGDIFVTKTKGHTGICIQGTKRGTSTLSKFMYRGVDYSKVFDPTFYAKNCPDIVKVLGSEPIVLFNHFIVFGSNEESRVGKTIPNFDVKKYGNYYPDLLKAFGPCQDGNYFPFYTHYCEHGYKENRNTI